MQELTVKEMEQISGGAMSTKTKVVIGLAMALVPIAAPFILLGYEINSHC